MYSSFQISARDLQECLNYFNLNINYSLVDLEASKFLLLKNNQEEKEKILNVYDMLYKLKMRDLSQKNHRSEIELYKINYDYAFKKKYDKYSSVYRDSNELNSAIKDVNNLVENHYNNINNCSSKEEADTLNNDFFSNYYAHTSKCILEYAKALNHRNNNQKVEVVNELALTTANNDNIIKNSLKTTIENFNNNLVKSFSTDNYKKIMLGQLNEYFKSICNYFDNPEYSYMFVKYQEEIDAFIEEKYNSYVNKIKNHHIKDEYDAAKYIQEDLKNIQVEIKEFSNKIFKSIYKELLDEINDKISNKKDNVDVLRLFSLRSELKNKNVNNFDDLSKIYNEINIVEETQKFAK